MIRRVLILTGVMLSLIVTAGCRSKADLNLKTVNARASAVYCLFDPSCTVTATDSSTTPIPIQVQGTSFLQSRTFAGKPGTPAAGLYGYEYRIDLEKAVEVMVDVEEVGKLMYMPCLRSIALEFGPIVDTLDYDGDGEAGDLIYVATDDGPTKVGIGSVERFHGKLTLNFDSPVCVGSADRQGNSTYFFGLVSAQPPRRSVIATLKETTGNPSASPKMKKNIKYNVEVYAPQLGT